MRLELALCALLAAVLVADHLAPAEEPLRRQARPAFAMVSVATPPSKIAFYQRALDTKLCYAARHGYMHYVESGDMVNFKLNNHWNKIPAVRRALPHFEHVLWNDADTLVQNSSIPLEFFLPDETALPPSHRPIELVIGPDHHEDQVNNGVFMLRRSEWSFAFLESWYGEGGRFSYDNFAMWNAIMRTWPDYDDECGSDPMRSHLLKTIKPCINKWYAQSGHPFRNRGIPRVDYIDPLSERRGFHFWDNKHADTYGYPPENYIRPSDFMMHTKDFGAFVGSTEHAFECK